jgi:hypothetical protein
VRVRKMRTIAKVNILKYPSHNDITLPQVMSACSTLACTSFLPSCPSTFLFIPLLPLLSVSLLVCNIHMHNFPTYFCLFLCLFLVSEKIIVKYFACGNKFTLMKYCYIAVTSSNLYDRVYNIRNGKVYIAEYLVLAGNMCRKPKK